MKVSIEINDTVYADADIDDMLISALVAAGKTKAEAIAGELIAYIDAALQLAEEGQDNVSIRRYETDPNYGD